jgi:hypothetical protein
VATVLEDWQKVPDVRPMQPAGGVGQVQAALGAVPAQGLDVGHASRD